MSARSSSPIPKIDFNPADRSAHEHLLAFLVAPFDAQKRRQFLAMRGAMLAEGAREHVSRYLAAAPTARLRCMDRGVAFAQYMSELQRTMIIPSGGLGTLVNSPPPQQWVETVTKMRKGPIVAAGRMLLFIAQIARHHPELTASTRRAHEVLRAWGRQGGDIPAERELTQMWKRYGSVAPLYAAAIVSMEEWPTDEQALGIAASTAGSVRHVLALAAWFRDFALKHTPRGSPSALLSPSKAIILPPEIGPENPPLRPLPPALLQAAKSYQAPQPAQ